MLKYLSFFKGYNLLYNLRRTVQINNSLVDAHLKTIPSFWTFSTRSLTCCDTKDLCWHSNRTLHTKILFLCSINQISTNCNAKGKRNLYNAKCVTYSKYSSGFITLGTCMYLAYDCLTKVHKLSSFSNRTTLHGVGKYKIN